MDIRAGNYCCSMDQEPVVYIEDQYSEGSLSSSLVIPTTRQPAESFAEVSISQVLFQRVIATTLGQKVYRLRKDSSYREVEVILFLVYLPTWGYCLPVQS